MTNTEIWEALQTIRNTLIQTHGFVHNAILEVEILAAEIQKQIKDDVPK